MKVKFKLIKLYKTLAFQIIEQNGFDADYRFNLNKSMISVSSYPAITLFMGELYIYLRGSNYVLDKNVSITTFESNNQRDEYYDLILKSFKEMSDAKNKI